MSEEPFHRASSIELQGVRSGAVPPLWVVGDGGATKRASPLPIKPHGHALLAEYVFATEFDGFLEFLLADGTAALFVAARLSARLL